MPAAHSDSVVRMVFERENRRDLAGAFEVTPVESIEDRPNHSLAIRYRHRAVPFHSFSIPLLILLNLDTDRRVMLRRRKQMTRSTAGPTSSAPGSRCADRYAGIHGSPPARQRPRRAS